MLPNSFDQVRGNACVECSIPFVGHDVDGWIFQNTSPCIESVDRLLRDARNDGESSFNKAV